MTMQPQSRKKKLAFRLAALVLSLSPFLAFEVACHVFDWGRPSRHDDPFVGFSETYPLFILNEQAKRYEIPKSRQAFFRPESFAANQPGNEFRIFVLGGSTVQGRPYGIETSFTTWLELSLQAAEPSRKWEVVNCGGISYASYRLVPIMQEVLNYDPDLIIVCTGHNEFLEDRTYHHIKHAPALVAWPTRQLSRLRSVTLIPTAISGGRVPEDRPVLGPETDARLDWKGGMDAYHRDEVWQRNVIAHFRFNLRRMIDMAGRAQIALLLVNPVSNLDWPPFKAQHRQGMSTAEMERFGELWDEARDHYGRRDLPAAVASLREALALDDLHAGIHYDLGKCYQAMGLMDDAKQSLIQAKDLDVCPLRMLEPMQELMLDTARETGIPIVDANALFVQRSRGGIPGVEWVMDHVHPTIEGHQLIAKALVDELTSEGIVQPVADVEAARQQAYAQHLSGLDTFYYARGKRRLEAVLGWARGQSQMVRKK